MRALVARPGIGHRGSHVNLPSAVVALGGDAALAQSVREIRALEGTMQNYELAEKYEISAGMVTRILNGTRRGNV